MKPKRSKTTALVPVRKSRSEPAESTALTVSFRLPKIQGKTPGERINFLHKLSVESGKASIAAGILAGWELSKVRQACDHGSWLTWLQKNTEISVQTARNYMTVYAKTLGASRAALPQPVPMETPPTPKEIKAASANAEANSITALYAQLHLIKRNPKHGGSREGAGRKAKAEGEEAVAAELEAVGQTPALLWASARGALDTLVKLDHDRDFLSRLTNEQLAAFSETLSPLLEKAASILADRAAINPATINL